MVRFSKAGKIVVKNGRFGKVSIKRKKINWKWKKRKWKMEKKENLNLKFKS